MIEALILGALQGIAEWLPVSSEGLIFIVKTNFFPGEETLTELVSYALFLHLGTFLAALIYFWKDVKKLLLALFKYKKATKEIQGTLKFLIISSVISGILGVLFLELLEIFDFNITDFSKWLTLVVALLLFITAFLQIKGGEGGHRGPAEVKNKDAFILGLVQSLAALPGLSRSGLTVSALLISNFKKQSALYLSFLMSLPIVLGGNIILNLNTIDLSLPAIVALATSFIFGLITIKALLALAKKINFGYFVLMFAVLTLIAVFIT
ncbi:MAG: undecaprenyl-diphosphate phosphatase [Candidatus Pacebacteria bacterium]|nr:undecaprenyl-diphosphate phosphatase [Candidatus Paceibacterota bacterium]